MMLPALRCLAGAAVGVAVGVAVAVAVVGAMVVALSTAAEMDAIWLWEIVVDLTQPRSVGRRAFSG